MRYLLSILALLLLSACVTTQKDTARPETITPPEQRIEQARKALAAGQPTVALAQLGKQPPETAPLSQRIIWLELAARARAEMGDTTAALATRFTLAALFDEGADEGADEDNRAVNNYQNIWQLVRSLDPAILYSMRESADVEARAWYHLGILDITLTTQAETLRQALNAWRQENPQHPAVYHVLPTLLEQRTMIPGQPKHIALLLPFTGAFAEAGGALLDGLLAAWYADDIRQRPQLSIYDTRPHNVIENWQRLKQEDVDFIIGPLDKQTISTLLKHDDHYPPILALNHLDTLPESTPDNLVQFGLAPEDEARQVAKRAWFDGHARALVLGTDDAPSRRIINAFTDSWLTLGGSILEQEIYDPQQKNYAVAPVKRLLDVEGQNTRRDALQRLLGMKIHADIHSRQDADFIFLVGLPEHARQLIPQLSYFFADNLPVYSTSHVYSGVPDRQMDNDLEGLRFVDIPWVLDSKHQLSLIQTRLDEIRGASRSGLRRLYAMGIDAYRLLPALPRMVKERSHTHSGETGTLMLAEDGKIHRRLLWATFIRGIPVPEQ